jgi:hypothetical protein
VDRRRCAVRVAATAGERGKILSRRMMAGVAVSIVCAAFVVAAVAGASGRAPTSVTIRGGSGEFFGYVKSTKPRRCAQGRKVTLFQQRGNEPDLRRDDKIASDIAEKQGDRYRWDTGNTGEHHGRFYAHVGRIPGCKSDFSRTIQAF